MSAASVQTFEAMQYDGTLDSYLRLIEWAKSKGDTNALANEWRFSTRIITFPSGPSFHAANPGDWIVWDGQSFRVWTERPS